MESFVRATELDPDYAAAHAGVADCHTVMAVYAVRPSNELLAPGLAAAERAVALAPALAEAHHALGGVKLFIEWDRAAGQASLRRAIELNPRLAISHVYLGLIQAATGRRAEAAATADRAIELEPDSTVVAYIASGVHLWSRSFARAVTLSRRSLDLEPDSAYAHWIQLLSLLGLGRSEEAIACAEGGVDVSERQPILLAGLAQAYAGAGRVADAERILAELHDRAQREHIGPNYFVDVYAALGRRDEACAWLERAYEGRMGS